MKWLRFWTWFQTWMIMALWKHPHSTMLTSRCLLNWEERSDRMLLEEIKQRIQTSGSSIEAQTHLNNTMCTPKHKRPTGSFFSKVWGCQFHVVLPNYKWWIREIHCVNLGGHNNASCRFHRFMQESTRKLLKLARSSLITCGGTGRICIITWWCTGFLGAMPMLSRKRK